MITLPLVIAFILVVGALVALATCAQRVTYLRSLIRRALQELGTPDAAEMALPTEVNALNKRLDQALHEKELYSSILDEMPVGVLLINKNNKITYMNRAARKIVTVDTDTARSSPLTPLKLTMEISDALSRALEQNAPEVRELDLVLDRPKKRYVVARIKAVPDEAGENVAVVVLEDRTEVRKYELLKRTLVSDFSHELRTPLTSIRSLAEALTDFGGLDQPERTRAFLRRILVHVEEMSDLIDRILQLARLESDPEQVLVLERVTARDILESALGSVSEKAREKNVILDTFAEESLSFFGDRKLLTAALVNLLDNAIKYSPSGERVECRIARDDDYVAFSVSDRGPGIAPEDLPHIFRRFYRTEKHRAKGRGGYGLGLSLVKHIVSAHDGTVEVESTPHEKTTFVMRVPLRRADQ
jgi:two-component system phosphate regulon sensor histidine kinase PhoR